MSDYAAEAGHWYDAATGEPRYRIVGANGVERDTTLRDAKKAAAEGRPWVPGYSTIARCAYKFQLEDWKQRQGIMAALTTERKPGETDEAFVERIITDSREQAKAAAARGTEVHAAIERWYSGFADYDQALTPWVEEIENLLTQTFGLQEWRPEKSFASPLGYGGKVDLHSASVLVDFKGKESKGGVRDWKVYDEHAMQLAAYACGLWPSGPSGLRVEWPTCGIIFFDRNEPYAEYHEVKAEALERGWRKFRALLDYWKADNL